MKIFKTISIFLFSLFLVGNSFSAEKKYRDEYMDYVSTSNNMIQHVIDAFSRYMRDPKRARMLAEGELDSIREAFPEINSKKHRIQNNLSEIMNVRYSTFTSWTDDHMDTLKRQVNLVNGLMNEMMELFWNLRSRGFQSNKKIVDFQHYYNTKKKKLTEWGRADRIKKMKEKYGVE